MHVSGDWSLVNSSTIRSANSRVGWYLDIWSNSKPQHAPNTSKFFGGKMSELLFNGIRFIKSYNNFKDLFQTELESVRKSYQKIHTKNAEPNWNRFGNGHWIKCSGTANEASTKIHWIISKMSIACTMYIVYIWCVLVFWCKISGLKFKWRIWKRLRLMMATLG